MIPRTFLVIAPDVDTARRILAILPDTARRHVLLLGLDAGDADGPVAHLPAERVLLVPAVAPDAPAEVIGPVVEELVGEPTTVVLDSSQPARDTAGWLAARLDAPIVWGVETVRDVDGVLELDRSVLGGSHRLVQTIEGKPEGGVEAVVLVKPVGDPKAEPSGRAPIIDVRHVDPPSTRVRVTVKDPATAQTTDLQNAHIVVSVGRGMGSPDSLQVFRHLAERLGAGLGASRVVVDAGWLPFAHQVGQTGTSVAPDLYLAFGISGAIQHLAGMRSSARIVAVNTDPTAPLCHLADVVVNADALEVGQALLDALNSRLEP